MERISTFLPRSGSLGAADSATEQRASATLQVLRLKSATAARELDRCIAAHTDGDGPLEEAAYDEDKRSSATAKSHLRAIQAEPDSDEREALKNYVARRESYSGASNALKDARTASNLQVPAHDSTLSEREIKVSVVGNKWLAHIRAAIEDDVRHLTQLLLGRIQEIVDRHRLWRSDLERDLRAIGANIAGHLARKGLSP